MLRLLFEVSRDLAWWPERAAPFPQTFRALAPVEYEFERRVQRGVRRRVSESEPLADEAATSLSGDDSIRAPGNPFRPTSRCRFTTW
jgi:hypothetical protein